MSTTLLGKVEPGCIHTKQRMARNGKLSSVKRYQHITLITMLRKNITPGRVVTLQEIARNRKALLVAMHQLFH